MGFELRIEGDRGPSSKCCPVLNNCPLCYFEPESTVCLLQHKLHEAVFIHNFFAVSVRNDYF